MEENGCSPLQRMEQVAGGEEEPDGAQGGDSLRRQGRRGGSDLRGSRRELEAAAQRDLAVGERRRGLRRGAAARGPAAA